MGTAPSQDSPGKVHGYCGVRGYSDKGATWVHPSQDSLRKVHSYSGVYWDTLTKG